MAVSEISKSQDGLIDSLPRLLAKRSKLSAPKQHMLEQLFGRILLDIADASAILLGGSFLHSDNPLDIDIIILKPATPSFRRFVAIERIGELKAEIYVDSISTLEERLRFEQSRNIDGLRQLLNNSVNLLESHCQKWDELKNVMENLEREPVRSISRAYVASQFDQILHMLCRTHRESDRMSMTFELLNLLRQTYHALTGQRTEGSLKHFLRRLEHEDAEWSRILFGGVNECLGSGDPAVLTSLITEWMARHGLTTHPSLRMSANGIEIRPILDDAATVRNQRHS